MLIEIFYVSEKAEEYERKRKDMDLLRKSNDLTPDLRKALNSDLVSIK